jgi:two-component SAPR family response regulator
LLVLEHFRLNSINYGLVLSDIRIASITDVQFARKVRKIGPLTKILLIYAFDIDNNLGSSKLLSSTKIDGFIYKPISLTGQISIIQKLFVKIENDLQQMTMFECPTMNRLEATVIGEGDKRSIRKSINLSDQ